MKLYLRLLSILGLSLLAWSCGDDDPEEIIVPAPQMVSVTPANGTTDVAVGDVSITVGYDQVIAFLTSDTDKLQISGGTITNARAQGKDLLITANCPDWGTTVSITIPAGLVKNTQGTAAPTVTFSFTTKAKVQPPVTAIPSEPVTASTDAARKLYAYMYSLYGKKVLSSVMANVNWNNDCAEKVFKLTGKYPAMNCYDFIHICFSPANWIDYTQIKPVQEWVNAGGLVQLMWHFNVPKTEGSTDVTCTPSETTFRASNVFKEGAWENRWFYEQMDKVAATLLKLQEAGIAATWRPFHEAAGNATRKDQANWTKSWFWWGYDGAETYKKLWVTMYDYFKQKGINNLIWVWTTQNYNGDSDAYYQDTDWYPGNAYVDIVGRDLYGQNAQANAQEFAEVQAAYPNKMVALAECGRGDSGEQGRIGECWSKGAKWSHFMVWYQGGQGSTDTMCSDDWWKAAMSDENVITRDQVKL